MLKKGLNIFLSILLPLTLFGAVAGFSQPLGITPTSFEKTCDMDDCEMDGCNSQTPKCPLCPSVNSSVQTFHLELTDYLPTPAFSFFWCALRTLSDQVFVREIFHPPTSTI
jgi:hypothetical protein